MLVKNIKRGSRASTPIAQLYDNEGNQIHPVTHTDCIVTEDGRHVEEVLAEVVEAYEQDTFTPTVSQTVGMAKYGGEFADNVAVDGYYKSGILFGNSLVNLYDVFTYSSSGSDMGEYMQGVVKTNTLYPQASVRFLVSGLKRNTKYIAIPKYWNNESTTRTLIRDIPNSENLTAYETVPNGRIIFTTLPNVDCNELSYYHAPDSGIYGNPSTKDWHFTVSKYVMIIEYQEGMENWDIPYFEGINSVKMPILSNIGQQMINEDDWTNREVVDGYERLKFAGWINTTSSSGSVNDIFRIRVNIKKGKKYYLVCDNYATTHFNVFSLQKDVFINENGNLRTVGVSKPIARNDIKNKWLKTEKTFVAEDDYKYLLIDTGDGRANGYIKLKTLMIAEVDEAIPYEDYKSSILSTDETVNLKGIGDVRDELDVTKVENNLIERIGERDYQEGDETNSEVLTDMTKTHYVLPQSVNKTIDLSSLPQGFKDGHVMLESGVEGGLIPTLEYTVPTNRGGQITQNTGTLMTHDKQISKLKVATLEQIINENYQLALMEMKTRSLIEGVDSNIYEVICAYMDCEEYDSDVLMEQTNVFYMANDVNDEEYVNLMEKLA